MGPSRHDAPALPAAVDTDRLWATLMAVAEVGATPEGGSHRPALTDADRDAQALVEGWMRDAGYAVARDRVGNLFAERPGADSSRPAVFIGSHLDTQPNGGRFDGPLGVLAAWEALRTLDDHGVRTAAPLVLVSWANEEGGRFPLPTTGSAVFAGTLDLDGALRQPAHDGPAYGVELQRTGLAGDLPVPHRPVGAYFEVHIEQGTRLQDAGAVIGLVERGQALRAVQATITGSESHAGTTPMGRRRDALLTAARVVQLANAVAVASDGALATVGHLTVEPNSRSVVPGRVTLVLDVRHPDIATRDAVLDDLCRRVRALVADDGLDVELTEALRVDPPPFDAGCLQAVAEAASDLGHPTLRLVSGAVHDAMQLARVAPAALIFVPCRDGISHHPAEDIAPEHAAAGAAVLMHAAVRTAGVAGPA